MGVNPVKVYMHAGIGTDTNAFGYAVVGNWGTDDGVGYMTNNGNGTWSKTITPSTYFNLNATQQANATKLGMVFRNATGTQTLKFAPSCGDFIFNVLMLFLMFHRIRLLILISLLIKTMN